MGNRAYLAWVRLQPCAAPSAPEGCRFEVEAHHAGRDRGIGQKALDETCIPLCRQHHADWHAHSGPFRGWDRERRRGWSAERILETRIHYLSGADLDLPEWA